MLPLHIHNKIVTKVVLFSQGNLNYNQTYKAFIEINTFGKATD